MMYISKTDEYHYVFTAMNRSILHLEYLPGSIFLIAANNQQFCMF